MVTDKIDETFANSRLTTSEIISVGSEAIGILEQIHDKGFIHRFLTSDSLVFVNGKLNLIEFFMAKSFIDKLSQQHVVQNKTKLLFTVNLFSSVNCHLAKLQGRKDDLESLFYVLASKMRKLPWDEGKIYFVDNEYALERKLAVTGADLFAKQAYELAVAFDYVKSLKFNEEPNYKYIRKLLEKAEKRLLKQ